MWEKAIIDGLTKRSESPLYYTQSSAKHNTQGLDYYTVVDTSLFFLFITSQFFR